MCRERDISVLHGETLTDIEVDKIKDSILFSTDKGKKYKMYHSQACCENVTIEDICGDLDNLLGHPLTYARVFEHEGESETYTFYKLATCRGWVDIRWYGESNGYYSEKVDFEEVPDGINEWNI